MYKNKSGIKISELFDDINIFNDMYNIIMVKHNKEVSDLVVYRIEDECVGDTSLMLDKMTIRQCLPAKPAFLSVVRNILKSYIGPVTSYDVDSLGLPIYEHITRHCNSVESRVLYCAYATVKDIVSKLGCELSHESAMDILCEFKPLFDTNVMELCEEE